MQHSSQGCFEVLLTLWFKKTKQKQHKAAYFVRIQSKQEQTAKELQDPRGNLGRRLLLLWPQSELLGQCWGTQTAPKPASNQILLPSRLTVLTISNPITESMDVFRPAASTFILMPCGKRWSRHPFIPDLPSFGQILEITATLVL